MCREKKKSSESLWPPCRWSNSLLEFSVNKTLPVPEQFRRSERSRKLNVLTSTETIASFVSHEVGPRLLSACVSPHMFLFKASGADCHDWCAHPPSDSLSNGWLPQAVEGRPFLSTALLIFHRETSPFLHSFTPPSSAAPLSFSFCSSLPFVFLDLLVWTKPWTLSWCEM